jgi:hypothetical protein
MGMMDLPFLGRFEEGQTRKIEVGQTKIEVVVALLSTISYRRWSRRVYGNNNTTTTTHPEFGYVVGGKLAGEGYTASIEGKTCKVM